MSTEKSLQFFNDERNFLEKVTNKRRLIDFLWQTRQPNNAEFTVRDVIVNRLFSPFTENIQKFYIPIYNKSSNEFAFYKNLVSYIGKDTELNEIYFNNERLSIELYNSFWNEYSGLNSIIGYVILTSKYPSKPNEVKKKIVKWYEDERRVAFQSMNGALFNYAFIKAFPAIHNFLKDFAMSIVCSFLANEASNSIRNAKSTNQLLKDFENEKSVQTIVKSKAPRNLMFEYLFLLDISIEEIDEFKKLTITHLEKFMDLNFPDSKLTILEKIISDDAYFDESILKTCPEFFLKVELSKDLSAYVLDPYFKTII